mmetsp:Transcript_46122/g.64098  ORF Transcript_46122/g.64098 Transcript_46122/m.64098 type:complete len:95 (-) Transcript_46122:428-712(-)
MFKFTFGSEDTTQVRVLPLQGYLKVIWFHVDEKLYMAQSCCSISSSGRGYDPCTDCTPKLKFVSNGQRLLALCGLHPGKPTKTLIETISGSVAG